MLHDVDHHYRCIFNLMNPIEYFKKIHEHVSVQGGQSSGVFPYIGVPDNFEHCLNRHHIHSAFFQPLL